MGFGAILQNLITPATQAVGAYDAGQQKGQQQQVQNLLTMLELKRQQANDEMTKQLHQAQIKNYESEATARLQPKPIEGYTLAPGAKRFRPDGTVEAENADRTPKPPTDQFHAIPQPDGSVKYVWANPATHTVTETGLQGGKAPGGTGKGNASGAQVPLDDMLNRFEEIQQHADRIGKGQQKITRAYQTREGSAYSIARESAAGHDVPFKQMAIAGAQDKLPESLGGVDPNDPDFQSYQALMNSVRSLNDDAAKVFKGRQNEEAVLREIALNQPTPDDYKNPAVLAQKIDRLKNIIKKAALDNPEQAQLADPERLFRVTGVRAQPSFASGRGGEAPSGPPTGRNPGGGSGKLLSRDEWDAVKAQGVDPAKFGYTLRP